MPIKDPVRRAVMAKVYKDRWYARFKESHKKKVYQRREGIKEFIRSLKATKECQACGENDPRCLDFHHRDRADKRREIGAVSTCGWSIETILKEVAKCDVLCANCHRKMHGASPS